jgi:N-acetylglucosaminyl-diphospho-decaprenol L-rhamnosyltransferase
VTLAVVTIVHGRHDHLALQEAGLLRSTRLPDVHVVVAMDDPAIADLAGRDPFPRRVIRVPRENGHLPLARARNIGAQTAIAGGATVLVFLDVDVARPVVRAGVVPATSAAGRVPGGRSAVAGRASRGPSAPAARHGRAQPRGL